MPTTIVKLVSVSVIFCIIALPTSWTRAQNDGSYALYFPLIQRAVPDVSGTWSGAATQRGSVYDYRLTLTAIGTQLQGTARVSDGTHYAVMSVAGAQFGTDYLLDEIAIVESNGAPGGSRWCVKTLILSYDDPAGTLLSGSWKQDGCNTGHIYLQRPDIPIVNAGGSWAGTATQSTKVFSYSLSLNQENATIQGVSTVSSASASGKLRVRGFVIGDHVILQETEILESGGSAWCLKTIEAKQTIVGGVETLAGDWSAIGCVPGKVSLHKG
jgi:hypothetical protein